MNIPPCLYIWPPWPLSQPRTANLTPLAPLSLVLALLVHTLHTLALAGREAPERQNEIPVALGVRIALA